MTPYVGDDTHPSTFFDFSPDKTLGSNYQILKDFSGIVQCDAASGFDNFFRDGSKTEASCNSHSRRKSSEVEDIEKVSEILKGHLDRVEKLLAEVITRGQKSGDFRADVSAHDLAEALFVYIFGMLAQSREIANQARTRRLSSFAPMMLC